MKMKIALLASAIVMFATTQASATTSLMLENGGFENPDASAVLGIVTAAGDTAFSWTAVGDLTFTTNSGFGGATAIEGTQFIQQSTGGAADDIGRISQLLGVTSVESDVTLNAFFAARNNGAGLLGTSTASIGLFSNAAGTIALADSGSLLAGVGTFTTISSGTALNVPAGTSVYAFLTVDSPPTSTNSIFFDNVTLISTPSTTVIPEPGSAALLSLGALGLGVVRRRRRC